MSLKSGDRVTTPDGEGVIADFEIHPSLHSKQPTYYVHNEPMPGLPGEYIRCGVKGCHPHIRVAYYPLDQINTDPQL